MVAARGGDRIKTAWVIGMTTTDSFYAEPATFENAMFFYRFDCICRAGWIKTAIGAQKRTNQILVYPNQKDKTFTQNHMCNQCNRGLYLRPETVKCKWWKLRLECCALWLKYRY